MGITAIASGVAGPASIGGRSTLNPSTVQQRQPPTSPDTDSVQLTEVQRVYQLYNQGQQVSQIADNLGLTVSAVNSYLNLSNSSS
jgi:DNA-binding NarL/FixJ family response regulator